VYHHDTRLTGPGAPLLRLDRRGVPIARLALADLLRGSGPALEQDGREVHVCRHLQELALPVLRRRFDELATSEIFCVVQARLTLLSPLIVLAAMPGDTLAAEEQREE
jgi:hypothetical protein